MLIPLPVGMVHDAWAVPLQLSNFNIIVAILGGFVSLFGLVSYLLKENFYLSEAREFHYELINVAGSRGHHADTLALQCHEIDCAPK